MLLLFGDAVARTPKEAAAWYNDKARAQPEPMPTRPPTGSTTRRPPRSRYVPRGKPARPYPLAHIAQGIEVLVALDRLGLLTNGQLRDLLFVDQPGPTGRPRSASYARKLANLSCQRLWDNGLVRRQSAILTSYRTGGPYLHFYNVLTPAGARVVAEHCAAIGEGALRWSRSLYDLGPYQVDHSLLINDGFIRTARAAARAGIILRDWHDDRQLMALQREGAAHFVTVPDGSFVLEARGIPYGHFLYQSAGETHIVDGVSSLTGMGAPRGGDERHPGRVGAVGAGPGPSAGAGVSGRDTAGARAVARPVAAGPGVVRQQGGGRPGP